MVEVFSRVIIIILLSYGTNLFAQPNIWCIPAYSDSELVIHHTGFTLKYNRYHKLSEWVAYDLVPYKLIKVAKRSTHYVPDPEIPEYWSAYSDDYKNSGYDRGHLAPAADMAWSVQAMKESFYLSNICPQRPQFNRVSWKKLEDKVRQWARLYDTLLIVTGPILNTDLTKIGRRQVSVPAYFFKAVVIYTSHKKSGIAFVMQNTNIDQPFIGYAITIDSLERLTGYNFFVRLREDEQNQIEGQIVEEDWTMP